jgi:hypothetical protein
MIAVKIQKQKNFMARLLSTDLFDSYLVEEATIETYNTFSIDGRIHKEFYKESPDGIDELPAEEFSRWEKLRPICLELIKGKQTPLGFKFVLHLDSASRKTLFESIDSDITQDLVSLGIVIKYASGTVTITTGASYSVFTLDKEAEKAWDKYIPSFLESNGIEVETL